MKTTDNLQPAECSDAADTNAEIDLLDKSLTKLIVQFDQFHAAIAPHHDAAAKLPQQPVAPMNIIVREFNEADRAPPVFSTSHPARPPPTLKCMKANTKALQFYASQGCRTLREEIGPDGPYFLMTKP